jgi:membrane-associated phospholipid phosphatase
MAPMLPRLRPLEWALITFLGFVLARAGSGVFLHWTPAFLSRATTALFALALVSALQLFVRFTSTPWKLDALAQRVVVWATLPIAVLPWLFSVWALALGSATQALADLPPAAAFTAGASLLMRSIGVGLPTFLVWLLLASILRRDGGFSLKALRAAVVTSGSLLRDWAPLIIIFTGYEWMRGVVDAGFTTDRDGVMQAVDRWLFFGADPLDALEKCIVKPLTEVLAIVYSSYALLFPVVLGTVLLTGGRAALQLTAFRIGLGLLVAYVGYCVVPVKGPLFTRTFDVPLDTYLVGPIKEAMMDATRISYDCFPSMHTCGALLLGFSAYVHARRLFWALCPIVAAMPVACLYLRYHYVVDVLAGAALAGGIILLTKRLEPCIVTSSPSTLAPAKQGNAHQ